MSLRNVQGRILVCATPATIGSQIYQQAFLQQGVTVETYALRELAGAIERGESEEELLAMIAEVLTDIRDIDVLVLACTHYPLVRHLFERVLPEGVTVVDPASAVAAAVKSKWADQAQGTGAITFHITQDSVPFRALVGKLFPDTQVRIEVVE